MGGIRVMGKTDFQKLIEVIQESSPQLIEELPGVVHIELDANHKRTGRESPAYKYHDITLEHILLALNDLDKFGSNPGKWFCVCNCGYIKEMNSSSGRLGFRVLAEWKLGKPLDDQEPRTISWLIEALVIKDQQ